MVKRNFWLGILVMVLVFGFLVIGCGDDQNNDDNGKNDGGIFTLTDIPDEHDGKYALIGSDANEDGEQLWGSQNLNTQSSTASPISNGTVNIPMWIIKNGNFNKYNGNGTFDFGVYLFDISIINHEEVGDKKILENFFESVKFSNGSATKSWNDGEITEE